MLYPAARCLCRQQVHEAGSLRDARDHLSCLADDHDLCAKYDGEVVGTLSLIRESVLGFPLQRIFDLTALREKKGNIAEVSALAIHRRFRRTGGSILFPLMKFMYEYCTTFFDTRHLVIAVNPSHIEMYESLLFFKRLTQNVVENYDFVNGAPAFGATLDLSTAPEVFRKHYSSKPPKRNLHAFFTEVRLPNIKLPPRRFYTTNDPVLTPELLDHFFNVRTSVFMQLSDRKKKLLHTIYDLPAYRSILPALPEESQDDRGPTGATGAFRSDVRPDFLSMRPTGQKARSTSKSCSSRATVFRRTRGMLFRSMSGVK
jgi:hypothetical protein